MGDAGRQTTGIRTFEVVVSVTSFMQGKIDDWPSNVQDHVYGALERKSREEGIPLVIVYSESKVDPDVPEGMAGRFYIHVIASEVVVADERTLTPGRVIGELPEDIRRLLN